MHFIVTIALAKEKASSEAASKSPSVSDGMEELFSGLEIVGSR